jgi:hypothetical protein
MRSTAHRLALMALLLPTSWATAAPATAAAAKAAGYSFKGSAVLVNASAGCSNRRKLTPGERFDFTFIRSAEGGDLLLLFWRPGFRWFWPTGHGPFKQRGPYQALTSIDGKIALIFEGTYESFVRKPAEISPDTARIELSFTTRNQDKSETCTVTWRASANRARHSPAEVEALVRRLPSGRK